MKRVISDMHMREVTICYGMTETSPVSFQSRRDDTVERRVVDGGHDSSAPGSEDRGRRTGRVVPRGERGELLTRGYSVMQGYWDDEEKTRQSVDEQGWMHTGDLATLDAAGYCNIVGRVKDLIIRGGENISPREIEEFLFTHPQIQDVQVFGVPGPTLRRSGVRVDQAEGGRALRSRSDPPVLRASGSRTSRCRSTSASWSSSR